jgi:3-hydroxybutyryl-CoA dehydratase
VKEYNEVRGLYFEEFEMGLKITTSGRTITEADVVGFAGMSGDYNQIHTDAVYSKGTPAGARIAHGLLVMSIASGLVVLTGMMEGTVLVFREIKNWKFIKPVYFNTTIHVEMSVVGLKAFRRLGGGLVETQIDVKNQDGDTVMKGVWSSLIRSKPE